MDADYGTRFTNAFKHAVKLCGGKSSIAAFEPNATHSDEAEAAHPRSQSKQQAPSQSVPPPKDIPAIAKSADGAIATIVMANGDQPLSQGTGFLVSADGMIVTNYHVIETGNSAIVKFPNGTTFSVDGVLGGDKVRDLAVIKIHGKTFQTLTLGKFRQGSSRGGSRCNRQPALTRINRLERNNQRSADFERARWEIPADHRANFSRQ